MSNRTLGWGMIVLGVVVVVLSLGADALGIGNRAGIGWKQLLGAAAGLVMALYGARLVSRKAKQ